MSEIFSSPEQNKEKAIDLTNLSVEFDTDETIKNSILENKGVKEYEKWLEKNKPEIEEKQQEIMKAVEMGILPNSEPETIYKFQIDRRSKNINEIIDIRKQIEENLDNILQEVAKSLEKFLPNWKIKPAKIIFTINEDADFCFDENVITADLERLLFSKNYTRSVVKGITHEIFHIWMHETKNDLPKTIPGFDEIRSWNIFKTIDEGLAVLISDMSLKKHHEEQKRNYSEYKTESFQFFEKFLEESTPEPKKYQKKGLNNMGYFYVVGYEVVKSILEKEGLENFKKSIIQSRKHPEIFLQKYGLI